MNFKNYSESDSLKNVAVYDELPEVRVVEWRPPEQVDSNLLVCSSVWPAAPRPLGALHTPDKHCPHMDGNSRF